MLNGRDWNDLKDKEAWIPSSVQWMASGLIADIQNLKSKGWIKLRLRTFQIRRGAEQNIKHSRELRIEVTDPKTKQVLGIFRDCSPITAIPDHPLNGLVDGPVEFECRTPPER